jgi:SEC-C motif-containing protein
MKKTSPNIPCPCGSNIKYKKCCQIYHKGAKPKTAFLLMKSRYCAFVVGDSSYIVKTTHENNSDIKNWKEGIKIFTSSTEFLGLEILEFIDGEEEAFVTFKVFLSSGDMTEKSRFLKVDGRWLYESGEIS